MSDDRPGPEGLFEKLAAGRTATRPPRVPVDCGHFDIRIARDGTWHYRGSPIERKPLVTLFSSVLRRDESGQYRSEEHTSELQSLMRISYAVFCLKKKK